MIKREYAGIREICSECNGVGCKRCYYDGYLWVLEIMLLDRGYKIIRRKIKEYYNILCPNCGTKLEFHAGIAVELGDRLYDNFDVMCSNCNHTERALGFWF